MQNPFPIEKLQNLEFGNVDGFKDKELENTFIRTRFINEFLQDKHSIIVGAMGSGKSALFSLLKNKSDKMGILKDRTIISIDESIPFSKIKLFASKLEYIDEKQVYQFIWKFHITQKISEKIASFQNFPKNEEEKEINKFLKQVQSTEANESIMGKLFGMLKGSSFKFKTKVAETPIEIDTLITKKIQIQQDINLDKILSLSISTIQKRNMNSILVIIDKIDTFVAGEEYLTQKLYIEALLEIDDDMYVSAPEIGRKIFLRKDLYKRLSFESLGYDKVSDNKLNIKWTQTELIYFLGSRLKNTLQRENILTQHDLEESNLFGEKRKKRLFNIFLKSNKHIPFLFKKLFFNLDEMYIERKDVTKKERYMKHIITKVFPNIVKHRNNKCEEEEIDIFKFFATHFFNAQNEVSPRNLLIFLKKVNRLAVDYYDENRDKEAHIVYSKNIPEWKLYRHDFIYQAYIQSTTAFTKSIATTQNKWKKYFDIFLRKRGNKNVFDLNWIKQQTELDEKESIVFCAYLESIGFLYISEGRDEHVKKRKYRLPIMYMPRCK